MRIPILFSAASRWHTRTLSAFGLVLAALFSLCSCDGKRAAPPDVPGPIHQAAPASGGVSAATEHAIADAANAKAELAEAKAAHDRKAKADAEAAVIATQAQLAEQRKAEVNAELRRFYVLAVLAFAAAGVLAYEGNAKLAAPVGIGALACAIGPILIAGLLAHETLVTLLVLLGAGGALVWHFRTKEKVMVAALEHTVAQGLKHGEMWFSARHPVQAVESVIERTYSTVSAEAHALAVKLHLAKAVPLVPQTPAAPILTGTSGITTANLGTKVP